MKNKIFALALSAFTAALFVACSADDGGATPGGDSQPVATMYSYATSLPYNVDNDIRIRLAVNDQVKELYIFAEKTEDFKTNLSELGEEGYKNYVIENGTKVDDLSENFVDTIFTDLYGEWTISGVTVSGGKKQLYQTTFLGLDWEDVVTGTYYPNILQKKELFDNVSTTLQVCTTNDKLFRFENLYGEGYSMKFSVTDIQYEDEDGVYNIARVATHRTPLTYYYAPLDEYGPVSFRDVGEWQGNDAFVTDYGYECGIYLPENGGDYTAFFMLQFFASYSAGTLNLGYNAYDFFIPDAE